MKLDVSTPATGSSEYVLRSYETSPCPALQSQVANHRSRAAQDLSVPTPPSSSDRRSDSAAPEVRHTRACLQHRHSQRLLRRYPKRLSARDITGAISSHVLCAIGILLSAGCGGSGLTGPSSAGTSLASPFAAAGSIYVAWQPHPDPTVTGYTIYYGPSVATATTVASNQPVGSPGIDPQAPFVSFDPAIDLRLRPGDTVCFRLKAYNADGESDFSNGACITI